MTDRAYESSRGTESTSSDDGGSDRSALQRCLDSARAQRGQAQDVIQFRERGGAAPAATVAERGLTGAGGALPFGGPIQAAFGHHDISGIKAHTDEPARRASTALQARAFATGDRVAFGQAPDLHTAAHEAAHVVQQRSGVALDGGVGREGDPYERHANAVADAVVAGQSAEALLDAPPGGGGGGGAVQAIQLDADPSVSVSAALGAALADGGEAAARQMLAGVSADRRPVVEQAIRDALGDEVLARLLEELTPADQPAGDVPTEGDPEPSDGEGVDEPEVPPADEPAQGTEVAEGPARDGDHASEGDELGVKPAGEPAADEGEAAVAGGDGPEGVDPGGSQREDMPAGPERAPRDAGAADTPAPALDDMSSSGLVLIHEELIEHDRWGDATGRVGEAGSAERALWIAKQAGIGFGQGAATGLAMGLVGGAVGEAAARFVPIPGVGAVIGGAFGAYSLYTRNWEQTGDTVAAFGTGDSGYEVAANTIAAVSEVLDIIINVLRTINAIAGAVSAVMWLVSILTVGAASPLAAAISGVTVGVGTVLEIVDNINNGILQPLVVLFRAMHAFQDRADPREVEADGASLQDASMKFGSLVGGYAGGKIGSAGVRHFDKQSPPRGPRASEVEAGPQRGVEYGPTRGDDGPSGRHDAGSTPDEPAAAPRSRDDGPGRTDADGARADDARSVESSNQRRESALDRLREQFELHRQQIRDADTQMRADADRDRSTAKVDEDARIRAELEARLRAIDENARARQSAGAVDDATLRRAEIVAGAEASKARLDAAGKVRDAAVRDAEARLKSDDARIDSHDADMRQQYELEYIGSRREFTESLRDQPGAHDLPETRAYYEQLEAGFDARIKAHDQLMNQQRADARSTYNQENMRANEAHGREIDAASADFDARVQAVDRAIEQRQAARQSAHEQERAAADLAAGSKKAAGQSRIDQDPRYEDRHRPARDATVADADSAFDAYRGGRGPAERLETVRDGMRESNLAYRTTRSEERGPESHQSALNRGVGTVVKSVGKALIEEELKSRRRENEGFAAGHTRLTGGASAAFEPFDRSRINPDYPEPPGTPEELDHIRSEIESIIEARDAAARAESAMDAEQATCQTQQPDIAGVVGVGEALLTHGSQHEQAVDDTAQSNTAQQAKQAESTTRLDDMASQARQMAALRGPLEVFKGFTWVLSKVGVGEGLHADVVAFGEALSQAQCKIDGEAASAPEREATLSTDAERLATVGQAAVTTHDTLNTGRDDAQVLADLNAAKAAEAGGAAEHARDQGARLDSAKAEREGRHTTLSQQLAAWAAAHRAARAEAIAEQQRRLESKR